MSNFFEEDKSSNNGSIEKPGLGSQGKTPDDYRNSTQAKHPFVSNLAFYMREAHYDPYGYNSGAISCFLAAFSVSLTLEASTGIPLLAAFVVFDVLVFATVRYWFPALRKHLDECESLPKTLIFDVLFMVIGYAVGLDLYEIVPGLDILSAYFKKNVLHFVIYVLFVIYLRLSALRVLYVPTILLFTTALPIIFVIFHTNHEIAQNLFVQFATFTVFYAVCAVPIHTSYVWNLLLALCVYLYFVHIAHYVLL
jgi:hypothetical protein